MAFNFNWSPLTADEKFYEKARDLLTAALNKSPKPPIIVDDILVTEFNLGSVPPELEILEIGDIAEDRFRGIFKMCYSGDAFLTLKTRVQVRCVSICPRFWNAYGWQWSSSIEHVEVPAHHNHNALASMASVIALRRTYMTCLTHFTTPAAPMQQLRRRASESGIQGKVCRGWTQSRRSPRDFGRSSGKLCF